MQPITDETIISMIKEFFHGAYPEYKDKLDLDVEIVGTIIKMKIHVLQGTAGVMTTEDTKKIAEVIELTGCEDSESKKEIFREEIMTDIFDMMDALTRYNREADEEDEGWSYAEPSYLLSE